MNELCRLFTGFVVLSLIGGAILYFAALKPLQEQNRPRPHLCPVCGGEAVAIRKSPPHDMRCAKGHEWIPRASQRDAAE